VQLDCDVTSPFTLSLRKEEALVDRYYRSGEFARRTSVSVRTLRFYDKAGLLSPSGRTEAGYRLYSDADLVRLQQILALKFLGFPLDEIKAVLGAPPLGLREAFAQQRAMLHDRRNRLDAVIEAIEHAEDALAENGGDWDHIVNVIRAFQMDQNSNDWATRYFNEEQLKRMQELSEQSYSESARAKLASRTWTAEDQKGVDEQYNALYAGVRQAVAAGSQPDSPEAQALAGQAIGLIEAFTGGDPEIAAGLNTWWKSFADMPADQRPFQVPLTDAESEFLEKAKAIYQERRQ
jgi:DNA-binding transcriptional MerR regulator